MPWKLGSIADDRRTITVIFVAGDGYCLTHLGYGLTLDDRVMTLTEYSSLAPNSGACPSMLVVGVETITLPLALDASVLLMHAPTEVDASILG